MKDKPKLHLGSGSKYLHGYVNIDIQAGNVDKRMQVQDIGKLWKEGSVREIRSHHLFEHFSRVDAVASLAHWTMLLCKGGRLVIEVPDFAGCAQMFLESKDYLVKSAQARHLSGDQSYYWGFHKDIWFEERFQNVLPSFGYTDIKFCKARWPHPPFLSNLTVSAEKTVELTWEGLLLSGKESLRSSLVHPTNEEKTYNLWCVQLEQEVYRIKCL